LQEQETILRRIGKAFRGQSEDITHETMPKRWVDLIHYLDEEERKRAEGPEATRKSCVKPSRKV
jgi:hypothetical protein